MKKIRKVIASAIAVINPIAIKIIEIGIRLQKSEKLNSENFIIRAGEKISEAIAYAYYKIYPY